MADQSGVINHHNLREMRSTGEILRDIARDFQDMVRAEIRLARTEITDKVQRAGKAGGLFGGAAFCGLMAGACFVVACIAALSLAMPLWLAALIMCVFLACIGGACYQGGRNRLKQIDPVPERTVATMKDTKEWANQRMS